MVRSQLVIRIAELHPHLHARHVEAAIDAVLARMTNALAAGDRIELRDFGSFILIPREAREARNPRTGAKVDVTAKVEVRFRPGKTMKKSLMAAPETGTVSSSMRSDAVP